MDLDHDYHGVKTVASMLFESVSEYGVSGGSGGLRNTRITQRRQRFILVQANSVPTSSSWWSLYSRAPKIWGVTDEDITPSDVLADPPTVMQGPMTRARMRQLHLEVSSFLSNPFHTFENRLLPNDVILLRNIREGHEELGERHRGGEDQ